MPVPWSTPHVRRAWSPAPAIRASIGLHAVTVVAAAADPRTWPWLLGALAANHLGLGAAGLWPQSSVLGSNLVRLPPASAERGEVALTFDDGPDPTVTPRVLELLGRHDAKASFFCIGRQAAAHPDLVREIVRRGHSVENHTDTHPYTFSCLHPGALAREVGRAQETLTRLAGQPPRFFRAPMGLRSPLLDPVLCRASLRLASWTRRGRDTVDRNPPAVLRRLTNRLASGQILLLHDANSALTSRGRPVVLEVLPRLLTQVAAAGLHSVSLQDRHAQS
jgi:peptidoglycan-N-acetylglucosamine deacetylase